MNYNTLNMPGISDTLDLIGQHLNEARDALANRETEGLNISVELIADIASTLDANLAEYERYGYLEAK